MEFDDFPGDDDLDRRFRAIHREHADDARGRLAALLPVMIGLDDDRLCQIGVEFLEELIDVHWQEIRADLEAALPTHVGLRKALSCCWLGNDAVYEHLQTFIGPGEDVGRAQAEPRPPAPTWEPTHRAPIRDVRLEPLLAMIERTGGADLDPRVDVGRIREVADPGAAHMIWPRFRCDPPAGTAATFYRCAVLLGWSVAIFEADLLTEDVDALPESEPWRIAALFKMSSERLPGLHELVPTWTRGDPFDERLP